MNVRENITVINNTEALVSSVISNVVIFVIFFLLFLFFRKKIKEIYEPYLLESGSPNGGLAGLIKTVYRVTDEEIQTERGLDVLMYLKVTKYLFYIVLAYSFYGCLVLLPVHSRGDLHVEGNGRFGMYNL